MLIIAYPCDEAFLQSALVQQAQQDAKLRGLEAVLNEVFDDAQVQLAMSHDLASVDTQATWNGRPSTPLEVTGRLAVLRRLMDWS